MMSCHMIIKGNGRIFGLKPDRVPGATFSEKRSYILRADANAMTQLVSDGGWYCKIVDGAEETTGKAVVAIPSGNLVIVVGQDMRALRWAFVAGESDMSRVKFALTNLIESFPEYRGANECYVPLAQHLGCRV